ncbi:SIR2 family protein [Stenotrophomonas maltophilia]|nr:SIR2 family protein [Stenotrophomonas maltophilia]MBH1601967.1 SIR2 family protein [Stenotrophomonas maltophilia]
MTSQEKAINEIRSSLLSQELVVITGTGVSLALAEKEAYEILSWKGLVKSGLHEAVSRGVLEQSKLQRWLEQLDSNDIDELLSAAEFMGRKLDAPAGHLYQRWFKNCFDSISPLNNKMASALRKLSNSRPLMATLNYDCLLEEITNRPTLDLSSTQSTIKWARRESNGILHLHGTWTEPENCILGIRDYQKTVTSDTRDLAQRFISSFKRILFIGCGDTFQDPNFSNLVKWLRSELRGNQPQHFALIRNAEKAQRLRDEAWQGFVDPVCFGENYDDLPDFIERLLHGIPENSAPAPTPHPSHESTLDAYTRFLIRDCGQMTIEGIKADLDTAQRKFDIERLFVPLSVAPCPPFIATNDPERESKIEDWNAHNPIISFGEALRKFKRIAILALPGGGKSLLLKRVAVAYADPSRRQYSQDDLPEIGVTPVLIRCREWRDFIRQPILTLLSKMRDISGDDRIADFSQAILPRLKNGDVLLLVDGLDEIHDNSDRQTFVSNLERFIEDYPEIRVVVTSREAGFDLVAPSIARFCERIRVCPLDPTAIELLTNHWHLLMTGDTPESINEAKSVTRTLLRSPALRRLAENPLLLTMLLVVKHGAGRLPPDRVSLYERAVEVLLDTWNIMGHEPLNPKEAMPQLSCIAFEMMRNGTQTATEDEILSILDNAREQVPYIRRYAKGTPHEFLKRVELRSSLLVEAGHQLDGIKIVPIYQFRHLTFQEYLAAAAAAEGHYLGYREEFTVLDALKDEMFNKEWREVVPMAAVLSRKQADLLLREIVSRVKKDKVNRVKRGRRLDREESQNGLPPTDAASLMLQCLVEEAEVFPATLKAMLDLAAYFGAGCKTKDEWETISRGPFGDDLIERTLHLYKSSQPLDGWVRNTLGSLLSLQRGLANCFTKPGIDRTVETLSSESEEEICKGLLINLGALWQDSRCTGDGDMSTLIVEIEKHLNSSSNFTLFSAIATWAFVRRANPALPSPKPDVLERIIGLFLHSADAGTKDTASFAITVFRVDRNEWAPTLSDTESKIVLEHVNREYKLDDSGYQRAAALFICFYSRLLSDKKISSYLEERHLPAASLEWLGRQVGFRKNSKMRKQNPPD